MKVFKYSKSFAIIVVFQFVFFLLASNISLAQKSIDDAIHPSISQNHIKKEDEFGKHYSLSRHYFSRADFHLAELEIEQAIAVKPRSTFAHRYYCLLAILNGDFPRALAEFLMACRFGQAIPLTDSEKEQLNEQCMKAHYIKGLSYEKQQRYPRAIFELELADDYIVHYNSQNVRILRSQAFNYGKAGLFDMATLVYAMSFTINDKPTIEDGYAHADFAYLLAENHNFKEAIKEMMRAVDIVPGSAALHVDLSLFLEQTGDLVGATHEMQMAIKTAPEFVFHQVQLSRSMNSNNHPMDWQAHHSDKSRPSYANLWEHLGRLLDKQNKFSSARKAYSRAFLLDSEDILVKQRLSELQKQPPVAYALSTVIKDMEAKNRIAF